MISRRASGLSVWWLALLSAGCAEVLREDREADGDDVPVATDGSADVGAGGATESAGAGTGGAEAQGSGQGGGSPACPGGILWIDEAPIERTRTSYTQPELAGDGAGFLLVTAEITPDTCEPLPCARVERFPSSGDGSDAAHVSFVPASERIRVFAGTDPSGRGHFAVAAESPDPSAPPGVSTVPEIHWGAGIEDALTPTRHDLDPARGLGAVAFDVDATLLVTHEWEPEWTIGEGFSYPIRPVIERFADDGTAHTATEQDPTLGTWFLEPRLVTSAEGAWLTTRTFATGPLRSAGPTWTGATGPEYLLGPFAATALPAGGLGLAYFDEDAAHVVRVEPDGARPLTTSSAASPDATEIALASDRRRTVLAHRAEDGIRVTIFDESLASLASSTVPGSASVGSWSVLRVAAASDDTYAVLIAPSDATLPVVLRRFARCEPPR